MMAKNQPKGCKDCVLPLARWRERLIAADQADGWLAECDDAGRFLAVSQELVVVLSEKLRQLAGDGSVLEICAGSGELAQALIAAGVSVQATDAEPPDGSEVQQIAAEAALHCFQPTVVIGAFVPFDSRVDETVISCPSVQHYVVLNARIGGSLGSSALRQTAGWKAEPLEAVRRWMLTRHDIWLGPYSQPGASSADLLRHGEAWHFARSVVT